MVTMYLGSNGLNASMSDSGNGGGNFVNLPLPDDQWTFEVQGWQNYMTALLQRVVMRVAAGPTNPALNGAVQPPSAYFTASAFDLCANQKVRDESYYSFSVVGLVVTILGGLLIIFLNMFLPAIIGAIQRWTKRRSRPKGRLGPRPHPTSATHGL